MSDATMARSRRGPWLAAFAVAVGLMTALPAAAAERLVSIGSSVTEILYALGAEPEVVGVDSTSLFPPQALKDKASVGYFRQLSAEGVLGLAPTRVIAVQGAGPKDTLSIITGSGVPLEMLGDDYTEAGVLDRVRRVGAAVDRRDSAEALASAISARFAELGRERSAITSPVRAVFVIALQNGRAMVAGKGTAADAMIRLAGAVNVAAEAQGYKLMSDEALVAAAPEVVVVMSGGGQELDAGAVFALPSFAATPAAVGRRLVTMDGAYLLGFGPRTPEAAHDLMRALIGAARAGAN